MTDFSHLDALEARLDRETAMTQLYHMRFLCDRCDHAWSHFAERSDNQPLPLTMRCHFCADDVEPTSWRPLASLMPPEPTLGLAVNALLGFACCLAIGGLLLSGGIGRLAHVLGI